MSFHVPEDFRFEHPIIGSGKGCGNNGFFRLLDFHYFIYCQVSDGGGWEHVSVSREDKVVPRWNDMCRVKEIFWDPEDVVIQFHPKKNEYVNNAPVLHLWRPTDSIIPIPPSIFVGIK